MGELLGTREIAERLGISHEAAIKRAQRGRWPVAKVTTAGINRAPKRLYDVDRLPADTRNALAAGPVTSAPAATPAHEREIARLRRLLRERTNTLKHAHAELDLVEERLQVALSIGSDTLPPPLVPRKRSGKRRAACAVAVASDWHWAEFVNPESVNGLNEYNLEIARKRAARFFEGFVSLVRLHRNAYHVSDAVLALLGDMLTGYLREEDLEENQMSPVEEIDELIDVLAEGILYVMKEGKLKRLQVPCCVGNHGRTTKKPRTATSHKNSYEWLLFQRLRKMFSSDSRITFYAPQALVHYTDVYGMKIRWHHGDAIRYRGGIQGLGVPMAKKLHRWDLSIKADLTVIGHYHQYGWLGLRACTNGSLVGWNAFAQKIGASPEPPTQAFFMIDSKRGVCQKAPIWVKG